MNQYEPSPKIPADIQKIKSAINARRQWLGANDVRLLEIALKQDQVTRIGEFFRKHKPSHDGKTDIEVASAELGVEVKVVGHE